MKFTETMINMQRAAMGAKQFSSEKASEAAKRLNESTEKIFSAPAEEEKLEHLQVLSSVHGHNSSVHGHNYLTESQRKNRKAIVERKETEKDRDWQIGIVRASARLGIITETKEHQVIERLTEKIQVSGTYPGSFEERRELLRTALKSVEPFSTETVDGYCPIEIIATFEKSVFVYDHKAQQHYQVEYTMSNSKATIKSVDGVAPKFVKDELWAAQRRGELGMDECVNLAGQIRLSLEGKGSGKQLLTENRWNPPGGRNFDRRQLTEQKQQCSDPCDCPDCDLKSCRAQLDEAIIKGHLSKPAAERMWQRRLSMD
jgi:hypothetical protein